MVDTIGPMVRAKQKWDRGVEVAHVLGGALGGAFTGFFLGALAAVVGLDEGLPFSLLAATAALALVAIVVDAKHEGRKVGLARQTPRAWRHVLPSRVAAFLNGFDLGLGWSTRIYFLSFTVAMLAAVLSGHALTGAAIVASFGTARALFVIFAQRRADGALSIDSIAARRPRVVLLNGAALLQFAVAVGLTASSLA